MRELVHAWLRGAVRSTCMSAALFAGPFASAHASAQAYAMRNVDGWTVAASKDKRGCFLTRTYTGAGGTTLLLALDIDGSNRLSVLNDNWSIRQMERLKLDFRLSNGGYIKQSVVGIMSEGKKGFVTTFEAQFPAYFAASKALHISRGDVPVEQLDLEGSGAAVAELRHCVGIYAARTVAGAAEKERSVQIPRDPFAPDAKRRSRDER